MSAYFEIAYAAVSGRLCLFTGTGFSKAVTENSAPGWQELLVKACEGLVKKDDLVNALFPQGEKNPLSLEEAAQVIDIKLKGEFGYGIHKVIAEEIERLKPSGDNSIIETFLKKYPMKVVTTNYDNLFESLVGDACQSIAPGFPIPRASATTKVYHVHGSTDSPQNMVVTSDDYFKFMHGESYFSRKLSTALHENTVVILGYSLADTNLKSILSDYRGFSRANITGGNLFLVSRSAVDQFVKNYYAHCYGIRVLDGLEIDDFFKKVTARTADASKNNESSIGNLRKVIGGHSYTDDYLKINVSFYEIIAAVGGVGRNINDPKVVDVLDKIIAKKISLTAASGAWEQYDHLADWLCHLATTLELPRTTFEKTFLKAVLHSMNRMSKNYVFGYSWDAYKTWNNSWENILAPNRVLIKAFIEEKCYDDDALAIVKRG